MRKALLAWMAATVTATAMAAPPSQSGHDLYQQALVKERAEGNLQEAIDLYEQIVRHHPDDHALAARALVQMGQCYEKLGRAEARNAYQRVIRDYGDQAESTQVARVRLAALSHPVHAEMTVRKVWADSTTDIMGEISPDGRNLSFVAWETGDLAVRDLTTGKSRKLTDKGSWDDAPDFALCSRWSPDGKQIAYDWYPTSRTRNTNELHLIGLEGTKPRVLYTGSDKTSIQVCDWSPDGREILVSIHSDPLRFQQIAAVSATDGTLRVIKDTDYRYPSGDLAATYSPDGRHILYSQLSGNQDASSDVFVVSSDGGSATRLVGHPANDMAAGWSPNGRWVLFVSDRTGTLDLWMVPVDDGKTAGEARLVKSGTARIFPLGFSGDGRYFYGTHSPASDIFTVSLNAQTGRVVSAPSRAIARFQGLNDWPSYSRDGARLAYVSARGSVTMAQRRFNTLCIREMGPGEEREFRTDFRRLAGPQFSTNGDALFVAAWNHDRGMGIHRVDATTGAFSSVVQADEGTLLNGHALSPSGEVLHYAGCDDNNCWIRSRGLASQDERELYRGPREPITIALSPDGESLAFTSLPLDAVEAERVVRLLPADGGEPREVFRFKEHGQHFTTLEFSTDGQFLFVARENNPPTKPSWSVLRVPVRGGEAEDLGVRMEAISRVAAHPSGERIALSSRGFEPTGDEVWVIENLLPEAPGRD